ncbi:MAG: glycosyltransferase family 4 protein [Kiritimatiellae bacterium]|nr:glycosyltransferase family 4 protein [Kiritimatiellia bacterium]
MDIQSAITQVAGVGRYARLLAQNLCNQPESGKSIDELILFYFNFMGKDQPFSTSNATFKSTKLCPGRAAQLAWKTIGWPPYNFFSGPADIYHFPNFILPPLSRGKSVVTIHDMTFLRFPQFTEEKNLRYLSAKMKDTTQRADAIITNSIFSASELKELMNVDSSKIFPIHLGISANFSRPSNEQITASLKELNINKPYILTVGTVEPRKNIQLLIEVFEKMDNFDGQLVIAGMLGWKYEPILERIRTSSRAKDIIHLQYVTDTHLPALYAGAELFALTSFSEGFGFPPLEAMACGTPVISSSAGALPEILGDNAILMDSFDPELWTAETTKLLTDTTLRDTMINKGHACASKYTWQETARQTNEIYKKVVG